MNQRGRKSAASLSVIAGHGIDRVTAPATLTAGELAVWQATVASKPADWFGLEHVPTLVDYCRHVVKADVVDGQIKVFDPAWLAEDDGLKRYERLLTLAQRESHIINTLARSMRLTHQAIYRADKAGTAKRNRRPWQVEEAQ